MICLPTARAAAVLAIAVIAASLSQPKASALGEPLRGGAEAAANWTNTQKVAVKDKPLNMTAFTVDIPTGWKYAGMILRPGGCHAPAVPAAGLSFTTVGPDGITAYSLLPGVTWDWASDGKSPQGPKCKAINITTAVGFLLNIVVPNMRPDARNITVVPLPPPDAAGARGAATQSSGKCRAAGPQHRLQRAYPPRISARRTPGRKSL